MGFLAFLVTVHEMNVMIMMMNWPVSAYSLCNIYRLTTRSLQAK